MAERMAKAEAWIEGHEQRCEERYLAIQASVADLRTVLDGWRKGAWALVSAVLGLAATIIGTLLLLVYAQAPPPLKLGPLRFAPIVAQVAP
jgi:hypothetical protein